MSANAQLSHNSRLHSICKVYGQSCHKLKTFVTHKEYSNREYQNRGSFTLTNGPSNKSYGLGSGHRSPLHHTCPCSPWSLWPASVRHASLGPGPCSGRVPNCKIPVVDPHKWNEMPISFPLQNRNIFPSTTKENHHPPSYPTNFLLLVLDTDDGTILASTI